MGALEALPPIGAHLDRFALRANKSLGQHFLFDLNLTRKIVRAAAIGPDDLVVEIGPGPGGLTRALLESGARVIAIDKDQRFSPILNDISAASDGALQVRYEDALRTDMQQFATGENTYKIVSNLPYNVGTQLLVQWLMADPVLWSSMTLMFQKEVAERVVAEPGSSAYGRLAVLCAAIADTHLMFNVPASAFSPPPKVESAVVHITPKAKDNRFCDLAGLGQVTRAAFGQRRKMLRASLKPMIKSTTLSVADWLGAANIDPTARPETLTPEEFICLTRLWKSAITK